MNEEMQPPLKRVKLNREELEGMSKEEILERYMEREAYLDSVGKHNGPETETNDELVGLRESEEKLKQQQLEATRRENVLVMRLTTKEQEMQEYMNQIQELKQAQNPSTAQLRSMLLDPAINLMFQRMKKEMDANQEKLEQAQNDLAAWKFTPDSQTGKRLMAKCRMLLQENEELGKVISSGRTAKLEGEIALEKTLVQEMKKSQAEMDEFLVDLDEDVEGMQGTIYLLQQQLKDAKDQIVALQKENEQLRTQCQNTAPTTTTNSSSDNDKVRHNPDFTASPDTGLGSRTDSQVVSSSYDSSEHQINPQTTSSTTNGRGGHITMETDTSDGPPESCDEGGSLEDHPINTNEQYHSHQTSSSLELNSKGSSRNYPPSQSDGTYATDQHTDATSSEGWSPQPSKQTATGEEEEEEDEEETMDDDAGSSLVSEPERTTGKSCSGEALLQNGLLTMPQYDSQGDEEL